VPLDLAAPCPLPAHSRRPLLPLSLSLACGPTHALLSFLSSLSSQQAPLGGRLGRPAPNAAPTAPHLTAATLRPAPRRPTASCAPRSSDRRQKPRDHVPLRLRTRPSAVQPRPAPLHCTPPGQTQARAPLPYADRASQPKRRTKHPKPNSRVCFSSVNGDSTRPFLSLHSRSLNAINGMTPADPLLSFPLSINMVELPSSLPPRAPSLSNVSLTPLLAEDVPKPRPSFVNPAVPSLRLVTHSSLFAVVRSSLRMNETQG
jgi:hypothetical protein